MVCVEYNGGSNIYVGLSAETKPTIEKDGISEGAIVIERDSKKVMIFSGDESDENNGWSELAAFA